MLLYPSLAILFGLILLVWSSDKFVEGAASIAQNYGVSKLMIGLTIVALGTSAPEMLVSAFASITGSPHLALGNAIGSNIANIGLVLGFTAMIVAIPVHNICLKQDLPVYLIIVSITYLMMLDNELGFIDGCILFIALVSIIILLIKVRSKIDDLVVLSEYEDEVHEMESSKAYFWFITGLLILIASSRVLVWGSVEYARYFEISEVIIGLTIVAIGTSLPELAATLTSALKNHHDMAIGNIIGSNILNIVAVLTIPALLSPGPLEANTLTRDMPVMTGLTVLMALYIYMPWKKALFNRIKGTTLLIVYIAYLTWLVKDTVN